MLKKYQTIKDLQDRADLYFKEHALVSPREFRLWLGISKHLLSAWKKSQPDYFNLIKTYEDYILAKIEAYAIYGALHPDIRNTKASAINYDKDGNKIKEEWKFNQVGAIFTLRAYDKDQYVPEIAHEQDQEELTQVQVITHDITPEKGAQSGRPIKLIK